MIVSFKLYSVDRATIQARAVVVNMTTASRACNVEQDKAKADPLSDNIFFLGLLVPVPKFEARNSFNNMRHVRGALSDTLHGCMCDSCMLWINDHRSRIWL